MEDIGASEGKLPDVDRVRDWLEQSSWMSEKMCCFFCVRSGYTSGNHIDDDLTSRAVYECLKNISRGCVGSARSEASDL